MIFTPQNHQTKLIISTKLNRNQHTGTLPAAQQNQKQYSRPMEKVRRNDRMMPAGRVDLKVFDVDMVDITPQEHKPRKDRNKKNKWGERSKDWRRIARYHKRSTGRALNGMYDLRKERERTAQALREWRDGDVNPWDSFWSANWYEDCDYDDYIDWSFVDDYSTYMDKRRFEDMWAEVDADNEYMLDTAARAQQCMETAGYCEHGSRRPYEIFADCFISANEALAELASAFDAIASSILTATDAARMLRAKHNYAKPVNQRVPALSKRQVKSRQRLMNSRSGRGKR